MTLSRQTTTTKTGTGDSLPIFSDGDGLLFATASSWGSASLLVSGDGVDYAPYEVNNTAVTFSANRSVPIIGGMFYKINVGASTSPITISIFRKIK